MIKKLTSFLLLAAIGLVIMLGANFALTSCGADQTASVEESVNEATDTIEAAATSDVDYIAGLGLMKGHLMVAKELMDKGDYEAALPHIDHPVDELYAAVEGGLAERNAADFREELDTLADFATSAPEDPQTVAAYDQAMSSIDRAIAALSDEELSEPELVHGVLAEILDVAEEEYNGSIADGQFVEAVEYQDSRGFVFYANDFYADKMSKVAAESPEESQTIATSLEALKAAWPDVIPPAAPVMEPEEVAELVEEIKNAGV